MGKDEMVWDLTQLVDDTNPAAIQKQLENMISEAEKIKREFHGKIAELDAKGVLSLLQSKDALNLKFEGAVRYGQLMYGADSTDETAKKLYDSGRRVMMNVGQTLAFIDIELGKLLVSKPSLAKDAILAEYRHYLERILRKVPHMLSEIEEQLIIAKDKNGINAWEILHGDWLSTRSFTMKIKAEKKTIPYGQIVGFYQSPSRDLRRQARQTVFETLGKDNILWASAMRAVCEDHVEMCRMRKLPTPISQSLIDNDVDQKTIDMLMKTTLNNTDLYQRYLKLKAKLMGLPKFADYDLMAPLPKSPERTYTWTEARREISSAYMEFDEQIGGWIDEMYENRHLDGEVRNGKSPGAWCAPWLSGKSAYILESYNGRMSDIYT